MSDWTIWGHKAHLILEIDNRTIEVLDPIKEFDGHGGITLDFNKIANACDEAQLSRPPKWREVKFDVG